MRAWPIISTRTRTMVFHTQVAFALVQETLLKVVVHWPFAMRTSSPIDLGQRILKVQRAGAA